MNAWTISSRDPWKHKNEDFPRVLAVSTAFISQKSRAPIGIISDKFEAHIMPFWTQGSEDDPDA